MMNRLTEVNGSRTASISTFQTDAAPKEVGAPGIYCYHCRVEHPREKMRLIVTKTGRRWRCIQSIEVAKQNRRQREAFGRKVTDANKSEAQAKQRMRSEPAGFSNIDSAG